MKPRIHLKELFNLINFLQLTPAKFRIYRILFSRPMTISDLEKKTNLSERMIRNHMRYMVRRGFVKKESVVENNRLKYVYNAVSPLRVLDLIKRIASQSDKFRMDYRKKIIQGTKESIGKK